MGIVDMLAEDVRSEGYIREMERWTICSVAIHLLDKESWRAPSRSVPPFPLWETRVLNNTNTSLGSLYGRNVFPGLFGGHMRVAKR